MAQTFYIPINQVFSNLGIIGAGYKLEFFETGTSTPKDTYSDVGLTVPNTNPVIADSSGRFPQIFVESLADYKAILKDEIDNVIWTSDPVDPKVFSLNDFDPRPASFWGTTAGTNTEYTLNANPPISENKNTHIFLVQFHITCGDSPSLDIDGQGALNLKKYNTSGTNKIDIVTSDLLPRRYWITNDGVDYVVLNPEIPATEDFAGLLEIATQAEVDDGTVDNKAVVPSTLESRLLGILATAIQSTNGYIRIPATVGGMEEEIIIQWGFQGSLGAFNFPITFPNAAFSIAVCRRSNDGQESLGVSALSASGATFQSVEGMSGSYIVIGY